MTAPADSPRARLVALLRERIASGEPMPWEHPDRLLAGMPRSAATGRWYAQISPWLLWAEAAAAGWQGAVWYTARAIENQTGLPPDATPVRVTGTRLFCADQVGLQPHIVRDGPAAVSRARDLVSFLGVQLRASPTLNYVEATGAIHMPEEASFERAEDWAATTLAMLVRWTRDERRLDREADEELETLIAALGATRLCAAMRIGGATSLEVDWQRAVANDGERLLSAIQEAERATRYLLDLAHPALLQELRALDRAEDADRPENAGNAVDLVTSLSQILEVEETDLRDDEDDEDDDRQEPLVLAEAAGDVLDTFLNHFAFEEPGGRKNPPLCAWLAGGPGTGRNQVVAALNALFRTGGTDLGGAMVATEGPTDLLATIERVWSDSRLMVLPCTLPPRVRVSHERAIPTACLQAFHIRFGLSPHLWVARLEHRLLRSGQFDAFVTAFEARTQRPWRGEGHRNPEANKEAIIHALGGADAGARRRVQHYERTRQTASWQALQDEASWSLFHLRPGELKPTRKALPDANDRRSLFVIDLSSALKSDDPSARGWLRRTLSGLPARMEDMSRPAHRPFWFLMTPDIALKALIDLVRWQPKVRRKQVSVDLDQSPVTSAVGGNLLGKDPAACGPIYSLYARHRDDLHELAKLDGLSLPRVKGRDDVLRPFPFLPCVLPAAQAVLDTFAGDTDALPLSALVRKALDEQFYAPPDRFVPLDVLLEPMEKLLTVSSAAPTATAGARIFVGAPVAMPARRAAFPHETILQTIRWANRVRTLPCSVDNLVRLMFQRMDRSLEEMKAEVADSLRDLEQRHCIKRVDGPQQYQWLRSL